MGWLRSPFRQAMVILAIAYALIEFGKRHISGVLLGIEVQDLLEDSHGASVETVLLILLGDLAVLRDGLFCLTPSTIGIANFQQQLRITWVRLQEYAVLLEGFGLRTLLRVFSRNFQYFSFIERQRPLSTAK